MEVLQRRLVICGVGLMLTGLLFGHAYSFISEHRALLNIKDDYQAVFLDLSQAVANANENYSLEDINAVNSASTRYRRAVGAHAHAINLGLLITIIGLIFSLVMTGNKHARKIAHGFLAGGICYPTGLALQALGLILAGEAFALIGACLVLGSLGLTLFSVFTLALPVTD